MKIGNRLNLLFSLLTVITTGVVLFFVYVLAKNSLEKAIYDHLSTTARSTAQRIELFLTTQKNCITQLSHSACIQQFLSADKQEPDYNDRLDTLIKRLRQTEKYSDFMRELFVLDVNGRVAASSDMSKIGMDQSTNQYFLKAISELYFKDAYYSSTLRQEAMTLSAPVTDSDTGKLLGVIVARIRLEILNKISTDWSGRNKTGEIYLLNKDGYLITPSRYIKNAPLKLKIDSENRRQCMKTFEEKGLTGYNPTPLIYADYRGVRVLGTYACIPLMQWCLVAKIDEKEAFALLFRLKYIFVVVALVIPVWGWLLGGFVAGTITGPILELRKGTEIISRGDLDYKVGTDSKDEIGQLAKAFDDMTEKLKTTTTSINDFSKEIVERKKTEETLRETSSYLENLFNYANAPIIVWDPEVRVTRFNHAFEHLTGYPAGEVIGKKLNMLLPAANRDQTLDRIVHASSGEYWESVEIPILRTDGDIRMALWNSANIYDRDGTTIIATIAQGQDITERKKAEESLTKALQIKSDFTSMVSHELRTPLTSIKESIALVLEGIAGTLTAKQHELLDIAKRNVDRLARLINDVLDFQKLESGKLQFQMRKNDINRIVAEVQKGMTPLAREKGLDLVVNLDTDLPVITSDRDKIIQVLTNIVDNAVKFTEKGGITIVTSRNKKDDVVLVSVQDTGIGIKKEDMPRLFQRFEQIAGIKESKAGGTGLGLALSKELIEKHDGKIWAESGPGKGTTFHFTLPVK